MGKDNKCLKRKQKRKQKRSMPKKSLNINPFHGGLNEHTDARDIQHHELSDVQNLAVSEVGRVRMIGRINDVLTKSSSEVKAGSGLYLYSSDRTISNGAESPSQYIVVGDSPNGKVYFYEKKADGTTQWTTTFVNMGGSFKPVYYYADGVLRIHDGDFTRSSRWFGYVDSGLYQDTANSNTPIHTITEFVDTEQKLKSFSDLSKTVAIHDSSSVNPDATDLGSNVILSYWTSDGGFWSGIYEFGLCPVYLGGAEGPITIASGKVALSEDQLAVQLFVLNASHSPADDAAHDLGDDRIIGVNAYFRENGTKDFYFLKRFDLRKGGNDRWRKFDTSTHTAYGIFSGSIALNSNPSSTESYATTTITGTITNNANGFSGRAGYLRLIGAQESPIYFNLTSLASGNHSIPIVNPGPGDRQFKLELLDENFFVLAESSIRTVTISDSGDSYPSSYTTNPPGGGGSFPSSGDPDDDHGGEDV